MVRTKLVRAGLARGGEKRSLSTRERQLIHAVRIQAQAVEKDDPGAMHNVRFILGRKRLVADSPGTKIANWVATASRAMPLTIRRRPRAAWTAVALTALALPANGVDGGAAGARDRVGKSAATLRGSSGDGRPGGTSDSSDDS